MNRTYRYRLYPTRRQVHALEEQLGAACDIYNAALEQRRRLWREHGTSIGFYEQSAELTEARRAGLTPAGMNATCQADALRRLDRAFEAFFRRVRRGENPGYPRFRARARYDSLTWRSGKAGGWGIIDGRLRLQGVGHVKVKWHRAIPEGGEIKTTTVRRSAGRWYVCFSLEMPAPEPLPRTGKSVGLDLGVQTFAALSTGELVAGPRSYRKTQAALRRAQRKVARRKRDSNRRAKAATHVARLHAHIADVRRDHRHKTARSLVERFDTIAVEDLNVASLGRSMLAKHIHDQGWTQFVSCLRDKAEEAGRTVVLVDPRGTSQACSGCGQIVRKDLSVRVHECECGLTLDRDVNAARNVLARGLGRSPQAPTGTVLVA